MQKNLKKLTLLHSNDLHGDFLAERVDEKLIGGVSRLSGYVSKVRDEEKNVIYAIAGDMLRGSLIDSEYQGISTIEIMNLLAPDVVSLGNHEVDYGLSHLLFLEKCASFPILCANMYVKHIGKRLFSSHWIKEIDGMRVLFIGVLTEQVLRNAKREELIGSLVDMADASDEVGKICDAYRSEDIDFTVLLTHIGIEEDKKLAATLNPAWGVDMIIGGHSHTLLSEPCEVAGIPIVQAAVGTDQIGRFDILVDTDNNCIHSYTWQCIPITDENCPRDEAKALSQRGVDSDGAAVPTAIALTWGVGNLDETTVPEIAARAENTGRLRFVCGMTAEEAEGMNASGSRLPMDIVRITIVPMR